MKFARYTNLFEKKAKRKFLYLSHSCVRDPKRYLRIGNLHHRSHWICISFQKASHRFLQNLFSSYSFPYPPSSPPPLQIYNDPASKVLGQTAGLSVFQLGCTISFLSLFFFFDAGCQWPVPRNGDVPWNQFFLPDFLLGKTRLLLCLRNLRTLEKGPVFIVRRASIPLPSPFSTRFVSVGVRQTPVSNSVIYLAYVCQRNPLSLSLSSWKTRPILGTTYASKSLLLSYFPLSREARDEINLAIYFVSNVVLLLAERIGRNSSRVWYQCDWVSNVHLRNI